MKHNKHNAIVFLRKIVMQLKDESIPLSFKTPLYLLLTRPNPNFESVCRSIGINPIVWRAKYRQLFSHMFI